MNTNQSRTGLITWLGHFALAALSAHRRVVIALITLLLVAFATPCRAQCPEGWLPGASVPGINGDVIAMAVLPDGDVLVGGNFTATRNMLTNYIARFNPTTGVWSIVGSGTNSIVNVLTVLPSGDVIVGGPSLPLEAYRLTA